MEEFYNVERFSKNSKEWVVVFRCPTELQANTYVEYHHEESKKYGMRIVQYKGTCIKIIPGELQRG